MRSQKTRLVHISAEVFEFYDVLGRVHYGERVVIRGPGYSNEMLEVVEYIPDDGFVPEIEAADVKERIVELPDDGFVPEIEAADVEERP